MECSEPLFIIASQFVGGPSGGCGICFHCNCAPLTISVAFPLDVEYVFSVGFQHPAVDGCSRTSCDFGASQGGHDHTSCYSAIVNQSPKSLFNFERAKVLLLRGELELMIQIAEFLAKDMNWVFILFIHPGDTQFLYVTNYSFIIYYVPVNSLEIRQRSFVLFLCIYQSVWGSLGKESRAGE